MRWALVLVAMLGCGRLGFDELAGSGDGGTDAASRGFSRVAAYADQTCAVYEGSLYCWGRNDQGALGDGTEMDRSTPTKVHVPVGPIADLTVGDLQACAIVNAQVYCWGSPDFTPDPTVTPVLGIPTEVGTGRSFRCVLTDDKVACWGSNADGQLGDNSTNDHAVPAPIASIDRFVAIDLGDDHACALTTTNKAVCWGHNDDGTLGHGAMNPPFSPTPQMVINGIASLPRIGGWHACATSPDRTVQCWGRNSDGELGDGTTAPRPAPTPVSVTTGMTAVDLLAVGGGPTDLDSSCAAAGSSLWCWGHGTFGRLGNNAETDEPVPRIVTGLPANIDIAELAIGYRHTCARMTNGELYCWGAGDRGQLGDGLGVQSYRPVRVNPPM